MSRLTKELEAVKFALFCHEDAEYGLQVFGLELRRELAALRAELAEARAQNEAIVSQHMNASLEREAAFKALAEAREKVKVLASQLTSQCPFCKGTKRVNRRGRGALGGWVKAPCVCSSQNEIWQSRKKRGGK